MAARNERLWHDVHQAHLDRVDAEVWRDHAVEIVGDVIAISNTDFLVQSRVNGRRESFRFDDPALVIGGLK